MRERRWPRTERVGEGVHASLLEGAEDREVLGGEPGLEAQGGAGSIRVQVETCGQLKGRQRAQGETRGAPGLGKRPRGVGVETH